MTALVLVVPTDLDAPTGGNRYDEALARALGELGVTVQLRPAPGRWPVASAADRDRLAGLLQAAAGPVLVDGLLACGAPEAVVTAVDAGSLVHVLVHLPLGLETGLGAGERTALGSLEQRALRSATGVVATSHWAAADLCRRHGLAEVAVAAPGTEPAPVATGSTPPRLLQLASVTPRKGQLVVVEALAQVADLSWTADLTGALDVDPAYAAAVQAAIDRLGLTGRITLTGPVAGTALDAVWAGTDLVLLPSHAETWGLAVTEGLARGIPAVVGAGTGAEEALGRAPDGTVPGVAVPPGDPVALAGALRHLLGPGRSRTRAAARARGRDLRDWHDTGRDVLAAVR